MKHFYFPFLLSFVAITAGASTLPSIDNDLLLKAEKQIQRMEYFCKYKDNRYLSFNRNNELRTSYTASAMTIISQQGWTFQLSIQEVAGYKPVAKPIVAMHENTVQFDHDHHFKVEYVNDEQGVHQQFTIAAPAIATQELSVQLKIGDGWKAMYRSADGVAFSNRDQQLTYQNMKVTDANGITIPAHFDIQNDVVKMVVDAKHIAYPLSIQTIGSTISQAASILLPKQSGAQMGFATDGAGDVNMDGYADIMISAPNYTDPETQEGAVFIYYGSAPNGINPNVFTKLENNVANQHFGTYITGGGDFNGDHYADVAVGVPYAGSAPAASDIGAVYIYYGSASGMTTTPDIIYSVRQNDYFGSSLDFVKDLNDDGRDDLIIGASNNAGYVDVVYGSTWGAGSSLIDELSVTGTTGFGSKLSDAGDAHGYGGREIMILAGEVVYIYSSIGQGISPSPTQTISSPLQGISFGSAVAGGGDVNDDGFDDIVVGAKDYPNPGSNGIPVGAQIGAILLFKGSPSGFSTIPDEVLLAPLFGADYNNLGFGTHIAFAGDVDKDGPEDIISSEPGWEESSAKENEGIVLVFYGGSNGILYYPGGQVRSGQANSNWGISVAGAGDVNGDGYTDVLAGGNLFDNSIYTDEGVGAVFLGADYIENRMAAPASKDTVKSAGIKVFPNPVLNNLSVQYAGLDVSASTYVQLVNIYGIPVKTVQIGNVDNGLQTLDVSALVPGTYFLTFNNGSKVFKEKIIKQ